MKTIKIRQANLTDLNIVSELFDQYRQFQGESSDLRAAKEFIQARFENNESVIFIAEDQGTAIAFGQLYPMFSSVSLSRVFILNDLFVSASGRRNGAAKNLLTAIENYAWSQGASRVTLNVANNNETAQLLYKAKNWQQDNHFCIFHRFPNKEVK